jgi:methylmalonyl-CoA/ethylmalonyl-CoA epimerase
LIPPGPALDHVAIASGRELHPLASLLGVEAKRRRTMPSGVSIERYGQLEIVRPSRPGTPIERFLSSRGEGLHHLAFVVSADLAAVERSCRRRGVETAGPIERGSDGRRTLFLHPRTLGGVLVELVEDA